MRGIIDHHQDERKHLDTCGDDGGARRIDTSAGSACSLVANEAAALQSCQEDAVLSTLLLGTIAADCRGFDPKQRRFDWADVTAAHTLLQQQQQQAQQMLTLTLTLTLTLALAQTLTLTLTLTLTPTLTLTLTLTQP